MSTQTFNAQARIPSVLMADVEKKLSSSGMTISEYIRNLVMIDLGKFPINVPEIKLNPEQEKRVLNAIKEAEGGEGKVLSSRKEIKDHLNSLLDDK